MKRMASRGGWWWTGLIRQARPISSASSRLITPKLYGKMMPPSHGSDYSLGYLGVVGRPTALRDVECNTIPLACVAISRPNRLIIYRAMSVHQIFFCSFSFAASVFVNWLLLWIPELEIGGARWKGGFHMLGPRWWLRLWSLVYTSCGWSGILESLRGKRHPLRLERVVVLAKEVHKLWKKLSG